MEKAIAVVVSHNRMQLLSDCISALKKQTRRLDAILVVNNGSTDNTQEWLEKQHGIFYITQSNVGSGGGFNAGIAWAFERGYSWIWCMDDDGYPKEDAFEQLLVHERFDKCLLNCAVINKEDKRSFVWKTKKYKSIDEVESNLIEGVGHPFNGTLLHRSIVERVGLPKKALFLWGDETEYYYRITRQNNIPVYTVTSSIHYHPPAAFTYKEDWDFKTSWKIYFYVRNRLHIHKAKFANRLLAILNYCFFITALAGIIMVYQKTDKVKKISFIIWPLKDALINNYSVTPTIIINKLGEASATPIKNRVGGYMKSLWNSFFIPVPLKNSVETINA